MRVLRRGQAAAPPPGWMRTMYKASGRHAWLKWASWAPRAARRPGAIGRAGRGLRGLEARSRRRAGISAPIIAGVLVLAAASGSVFIGQRQASAASSKLGVLLGNPAHLMTDHQHGVRTVMLQPDWYKFEPAQGQFNTAYINDLRQTADSYRAKAFTVSIDLGLQYPPSWALNLANGKLLDQYGKAATTADFAWSQAVRDAARVYMTKVMAALGPVTDYRLGLSEHGETLLPDTSTNQWWAYTPSAQGLATGLPYDLGPSPMPGWVPGTSTYKGSPVTVSQAQTWYNWYFSASTSALAWEIRVFRLAGYTGQLELVMPGMGSLPAFYANRMSALLADGKTDGQHYDDFYTLNTASVWWKLLSALPDLSNVAVDISSVDDMSGSPRANVCTASDASVAYTSSAIWSWSDTRWLSYLATEHHMVILGENPGNTPASQLSNVMDLVHDCQITVLQWAWDNNLYANDGSATIAQLHTAFFG